jgi:rod shape-determining protein MreD
MRILVVVLLAFLCQGFISGILGTLLAPPDLVYLGALLVVSSLPLYLGLPVAFAIGLLQDLLSAGHLGIHAVGLLCAAYAYYRIAKLVHSTEPAGQILIVLGSFVAKWLGIFAMGFWLRISSFNPP